MPKPISLDERANAILIGTLLNILEHSPWVHEEPGMSAEDRRAIRKLLAMKVENIVDLYGEDLTEIAPWVREILDDGK